MSSVTLVLVSVEYIWSYFSLSLVFSLQITKYSYYREQV